VAPDLTEEVVLHNPLHLVLLGKVAQYAWAQIAESVAALTFLPTVHRITHPPPSCGIGRRCPRGRRPSCGSGGP
jgi:hypothetical protein